MKRRDDKLASRPALIPAGSDDAAAFRDAVRDVAPLAEPGKITHSRKRPQPIPQQAPCDAQFASADSLSDYIPLEIEAGDAWSFMRPGVSHQTLRRLRRGYWGIQAQLDLHGFIRDQARLELIAFLNASGQRGFRCVRVIHGKGLGSKDRGPVLKTLVGSWLAQRDDVLAFCQARAEDGGSGAVLVLLKTSVPGSVKS